MKSDKKELWKLSGYEIFSRLGPAGLKIEVLARKVNKNKSSFYHHFADLEVFTELLLDYHLQRATVIAEKERNCKKVIPDLLNVLIEHKTDLLFNRQLRIHRDIKQFKDCFEKASASVNEAVLKIWAEELGLKGNNYLAEVVLNLSLENFYLQITEDTLNFDWLADYINSLSDMVKHFKEMKLWKLNGSV